MKNSIVKIESVQNSSFGTGFVVDRDDKGVYILTCQHILEDVKIAVVEQVLATVIAEDSVVDIALLYVPKLNQKPLILQSSSCDKLDVEIIGFSHFNEKLTQKKYISATLYSNAIELHSKDNNRHHEVHKIKVNDGFHLERGNSGSPVICKKSQNVIAMISNKEGKNIGYAIEIKELKKLWKDMPSGLLEGKREEIEIHTPELPVRSAKKKKKSPFLKILFILFFVVGGIYFLSSRFDFKSFRLSSSFVEKYQDIEVHLKSIQKRGKKISAVIVIQNNGKANIQIQRAYSTHIYMTDENGKIWKCTTINSINSEFASPTIIFNDGRRIISEHIFEATESADGHDFYMNLEYIIDGKNVLFNFDHIAL